jgi:hypothetical protein
MFPHHVGNGPNMVQISADYKTLTNFDRDFTILFHLYRDADVTLEKKCVGRVVRTE